MGYNSGDKNHLCYGLIFVACWSSHSALWVYFHQSETLSPSLAGADLGGGGGGGGA